MVCNGELSSQPGAPVSHFEGARRDARDDGCRAEVHQQVALIPQNDRIGEPETEVFDHFSRGAQCAFRAGFEDHAANDFGSYRSGNRRR